MQRPSEVADLAGTTQRSVSQVETGKASALELYGAVAEVLGLRLVPTMSGKEVRMLGRVPRVLREMVSAGTEARRQGEYSHNRLDIGSGVAQLSLRRPEGTSRLC